MTIINIKLFNLGFAKQRQDKWTHPMLFASYKVGYKLCNRLVGEISKEGS